MAVMPSETDSGLRLHAVRGKSVDTNRMFIISTGAPTKLHRPKRKLLLQSLLFRCIVGVYCKEVDNTGHPKGSAKCLI